jgi:hypothetical protein
MDLGRNRVVRSALIAALTSLLIVTGPEHHEGRVIALSERLTAGRTFLAD